MDIEKHRQLRHGAFWFAQPSGAVLVANTGGIMTVILETFNKGFRSQNGYIELMLFYFYFVFMSSTFTVK